VTERFYSGQRDGKVMFRDGVGGAPKRPLVPRDVLFRQGERGFMRPSDGTGQSQIALTLLADALGDEARALEIHEQFNRRVVALFPERWTITRTRVLSYLAIIEFEQQMGTTIDRPQ
jgi:hypothetical protein